MLKFYRISAKLFHGKSLAPLKLFYSFRPLHILNLKRPSNIPKAVRQLIQKAKKKIQGMVPPTEEDFKKIYYLFAFCMLTFGVYLLKKQDSLQISEQEIFDFLRNSQTQTLNIIHLPEQKEDQNKKYENLKYAKIYISVRGTKYYTLVNNIQGFISKVNQIEHDKSFKVKITQNYQQQFDEKLIKFLKVVSKIIAPIIFPYLLYTSSIGKIFKSRFLGKLDGIRPNVRFNDVSGLGNAKIQVSQIVDFLKNPQKYKKMGARIPKGALLVGPPGTGKTMLAKACAGEAEVPFFSVSGSQFVELYAGMGAFRVRDLFKNAKKETPAIIFIDQIDAIGRKREDRFGGGSDERANTLNQLLVQMDGFGTNEDIIVLAATNRKQMLDNALTRPGRFDRMIEIDLPDIKGRQEILQIYLNKIKLSTNQNLSQYAKRIATLTFGFSGADLANLCNQAAILAVREQKLSVQPHHFQLASDRVLAGLQTSLVLQPIEKKRVAYHECGHAVTAWFLQGAAPLLKITIIPRSKGALGFAQYLPNEATLLTKDQLLDQLCVILGGRASQQHFFKQITNGASDDLSKARNLVRSLVVNYGMGQKHPNYAPIVTQGHNIFSEKTSAEIDTQVMKIIQQGTQRCRELIIKYQDKIQKLAQEVLKKQTLNHKQIKEILGERPFQIRENYRQFLSEQIAEVTNYKL